jgi:hypothetical protein
MFQLSKSHNFMFLFYFNSNDRHYNLTCKCVLTSRILHLVTHFVDLSAEMYHTPFEG